MTEFNSPCFAFLPRRGDLVLSIERACGHRVRDIALFPFSSASPTFSIELSGMDRVVVRGQQQNGVPFYPEAAQTLEKEIFVLRRVRDLGLDAPELLFDGETFSVPGLAADGSEGPDFRFFLTGYVDGIAVDRKFDAMDRAARPGLIDRIAAVYARLHAEPVAAYGTFDGRGAVIAGLADLDDFLVRQFADKRDLLAEMGEEALATRAADFARNIVPEVCAGLRKAGYRARPCLVLLDASHGNMMTTDDRLNLIDFDLAGYFEPMMELCTFVFTFGKRLLERHDGQRLWDRFLVAYRLHGGRLPPGQWLDRLLQVLMADAVLHDLIHKKCHRSPEKRAKADDIRRIARDLTEPGPTDVDRLIAVAA